MNSNNTGNYRIRRIAVLELLLGDKSIYYNQKNTETSQENRESSSFFPKKKTKNRYRVKTS